MQIQRSVSYFVQQLADFKSGARKMSGPERPSTQLMMASSQRRVTNAEVLAAAEYFAALKPKRIIKVVESETIAKLRIALVLCEKSGGRHRTTRPAHRRDARRCGSVRAYRNSPRQHCTAYVPVGSVAKGARENRWIGNDHYLQHLPRAGIERCRPNSADRRTLTNLPWVRRLSKFQHSGRTGSATTP